MKKSSKKSGMNPNQGKTTPISGVKSSAGGGSGIKNPFNGPAKGGAVQVPGDK